MIGFLILLINLFYYAFLILIIVRVIISFTNLGPYHPISQVVYNLTEPFLEPVRRILPPMAGLDFSPLIVLIGAQVLRMILLRLLI